MAELVKISELPEAAGILNPQGKLPMAADGQTVAVSLAQVASFEVPNDISDTTIDVGAEHVGRRNRCTAGTAVTINLEEESTQPIGSFVNFTQAGDGQLTFVAGDGVTTLTPETLKSRKKGSTISAYRVAADHWDITGDLEIDA